MGSRGRYARLLGTFWRHPKSLSLSASAAGVLARSWSYCADNESDGFIPTGIVSAFGGTARTTKEIVASAFWQVVEGGYQVHDWSQHNITKADATARRKGGAERTAKHRRNAAGNAAGNALHHPPETPSPPRTRDPGPRTQDPKAPSEPPCSPPSGDVPAVFEFWRVTMGKTKAAKIDDPRRRLIAKALKLKGLEACKAAIVGCSKLDWNMGRDPKTNGRRYNELERILKNAANIERFGEASTPCRRPDDPADRPDHEWPVTPEEDNARAFGETQTTIGGV